MFKVISSGSIGNAVIYHGSILVDCGISFASLKDDLYNVQLVLLTHEHGDHFNINTIQRLVKERPMLRIGCCEWMADKVSFARNIDIYELGQVYDYGSFSVSPFKLYHDVSNCGYRIFKGETKIFHATDTMHLDGIAAKGYDLYSIEHNYDSETILETIAKLEASGQFSYQKGAINSHLSEQQARNFIFDNRAEHSKVLRLHESTTKL